MSDTSRAARGFPSIGTSVRHHFTSVALAVLCVMGLATVYLSSQTTTYTATSTVLLSPAPGNPLTPEAASGSTIQLTVAMQTEAELLRTPGVRDLVSDALGRRVPGDREALTVTVPSNTQMLDVTFTSTTPEQARDGAQAFATEYLSFRSARADQSQQAIATALEAQIEEADDGLRRATTEASQDGASSYAAREVELLADRVARLNTNLSEAASVNTAPGTVINPAVLPEGPNGLPAWVTLLAASILGLFAGTLFALLLEWRRDLIRASDEADQLGIPVFSTLPLPSEPEVTTATNEIVFEAYRRLRSGVIANGPAPHVLAVAGLDAEYSPEVAFNLSLTIAQAKFSVLLINADLEHSSVEDLLNTGPRAGLAEVVQEEVTLDDALIKAHGFSALTRGKDPTRARELTSGPAFRQLIQRLHTKYDYVILSSARAGSADGDAVISAADSVLLVLRADRTTKGRLLAARERFEILGIHPLGAAKVSEGARAPRRRADIRPHREDPSSETQTSVREPERTSSNAHP